jgi:carboxyl-terminal processing protease
VDPELLEEALASAYIYGSGDRFASYYTAEEWAAQIETSAGNSVGIGVYITFDPQKGFLIVQVMKNSPAQRAGLVAGDYIVGIEGESVLTLGYDTAVNQISGEVGSDVNLLIERNGEAIEKKVTRGHYIAETVYAELLEVEGTKIGYIQITEFLSEAVTTTQFKNAVETLKSLNVEGLIFDVRDNPGGDLNAICTILDYLLPEGPIVRISYADSDQEDVIYSGRSEIDLPMIVLANEHTASAAELFTSALQDYEKASVVGQKTYGKGCGQSGVELSDGSLVFITHFLYSPPFSENYDGIGIIPDYEVILSEEWKDKNLFLVPHNEDAQLQKGVEILLNDINS